MQAGLHYLIAVFPHCSATDYLLVMTLLNTLPLSILISYANGFRRSSEEVSRSHNRKRRCRTGVGPTAGSAAACHKSRLKALAEGSKTTTTTNTCGNTTCCPGSCSGSHPHPYFPRNLRRISNWWAIIHTPFSVASARRHAPLYGNMLFQPSTLAIGTMATLRQVYGSVSEKMKSGYIYKKL